jgi:hypothetical protein
MFYILGMDNKNIITGDKNMKKQIYIVKTKMFDGTWLAMAFCETIAEAEKELEILYARGRLNSKIFTV